MLINMKRRVDYSKMNLFEKRRLLRLEKKAQDRHRLREMKKAKSEMKNKGSPKSTSLFKLIIFIGVIVLVYYFWEEIVAFLKGLF